MSDSKSKSKTAECREAYNNIHVPAGMAPIPKCINHGCDKEVAIRHFIGEPTSPIGSLHPSLKTECSRCSTARIKGKIITGTKICTK